MATHERTSVNYEVLWQNTMSTLDALSSLRISSFRIKRIPDGQVIVGGFGDVEQARLRTLFGPEPVVALKRLRPAGDRGQRIRVIASLARELDVWSKLKHPNILTLEGFYFDVPSLKTAWIATLWQHNGNLKSYLSAHSLDFDTKLKLALDTAQGLTYLHCLSPPVCHGDIKPENVIIDDDGNARLCDFGLSKVLEDVPSGLTTTRTAGCSLRYAAPELAVNNGSSHTLASDVWAWGCLLLVIITGFLPFSTEMSDILILRAIIDNRPPADLATLSLSAELTLVLEHCWKNEPGARPRMSYCVESLYEQVLSRRSPSLFLDLSDYLPGSSPQVLSVVRAGWKAKGLLGDASASMEHFRATGYLSVLEGAFRLSCRAASMWTDGQPQNSQVATSLGISGTARNGSILDHAINWLTEALSTFAQDIRIRPRIVNQLSICLYHRYIQESRTDDLTRAIQLGEAIIALLPSTHPLYSTTLDMLSACLRERWEANPGSSYLENAIVYGRNASHLHTDSPYRRASILQHLSQAIMLRYTLHNNSVDLEDALRYAQNALALIPKNHYYYPELLLWSACVKFSQVTEKGDIEQLEQAIQDSEEALSLQPVGHSGHPSALIGLSDCLMTRYEIKDNPSDLDRAIGYADRALDLLPDRHIARPYTLRQLGNALYTRFLAKGWPSDLELTIQYVRDGLVLLAASHTSRPLMLGLLAWALESRYRARGRFSDLEDAIQCGQEALTLSATNQEKRLHVLTVLASCLTTRHKVCGKPSDLEEAVQYRKDVVALASSQGRPPVLNKLVTLLRGWSGV